MAQEYVLDDLAAFVTGADHPDLAGQSRAALKRNVLDSIACAVGALGGGLIPAIRAQAEEFSGRPTTTLVGGGRASVDQAAFFNVVLVRYPDLLDTYLTLGGLCHPADNFGAILAVAEHVDATGNEFLLSLAVAYEVQCRFSAQVPVMARGLNHALQLAISAAAGSAKLLGLDESQTADAIAASAADNVSLAAVHAEPVSHWKGISPAMTGMRAVYATILAGRGITGPRTLIDGPHGLAQLFDQAIDFDSGNRRLTAVERTYLKQYCALIHGQVIIDALLSIRAAHQLRGDDVAAVTLEVIQSAYDIAGGGAYGDKDHPWTKEQADYNLKYLGAVALLDGGVGPEQLETERVRRDDVQNLLTRIAVVPAADLTADYPERTGVRVSVATHDGRELNHQQADYEGSPTQPLSWDRVVEKFHWLAEPCCDRGLRGEIIEAVERLDEIPVTELTGLLGRVSPAAVRPRSAVRF
ncbi:MmgE/PrpD family protein [Mycobacterium asiaticum]|uniref:MmgE/PrpD family protein n=1 Tax=Mycobacterium asiaticum TaxID=1790 RepID=UPI0007EFA0EA|nr:MmgE/PrpD family protein [Mycobacterium asiaticum]OBI93813.1 2-methylcitrate dehydratase [Mycobacterium asiaticum]